MKRRNNLQQLILLIFILSISVMACKKKKPETLFPDQDTPGGNNQGGGALTTIMSLPFSDDFNATTTEYSIPSNWYEAHTNGSKTDRGWGFRPTYGVNNSGTMAASSFGGSTGTDNVYLVTGPFNFSSYSTINVKFDIKKFDPSSRPGKVLMVYSTNYSGSGNADATGVTWTEINSVNSQIPTTNGNNFVEVIADLSGIRDSKVYLAFQFKEGTSAASATFNLDNFVLSNSTIGSSGCGTVNGTNTVNGYATIVAKTLPFTESFEYGCGLADYSVPADNWAEAVVSGYRTDRGWSYRGTFGPNSNGCITASTFVSQTATLANDNTDKDNSYLVVGPFNVTSATTRNIAFKYKKTNSNPGTLKLVYSTNYSGSGNPEAAGVTWTPISDLTSGATTSFASVTHNIGSDNSGPDVTGTAVYFGFQFKDGVINSSQSYQISNFSIGN